ncbi:hypothetical protein BTR23_16410 [Alkalihalophilus pseudofirmus]|nr:hypothetical protein BTR23_16410 [Alkalihalophilus pseudofirmus]
MKCCQNCFEDLLLIDIVCKRNIIGNCDYCEGKKVHIIDIYELTKFFDRLIKHYESTEAFEYFHPEVHDDPSEFGDRLINLVNEDWNIFSINIVGTGSDERLLFDILNANKKLDPLEFIDPDSLYSRITEAFSFVHPLEYWEEVWDKFKVELKHKNRFFPETQKDAFSENFNDVLKYRQTYLRKGLSLYRARVGEHPQDKMLAPPVELSKPGRANPRGISYLYCGLDEHTCVAEVRPWKGAKITVAELRLKKDLKVANFISENICPFLFDSPDKVMEIDKLLTFFSKELSTPVDPNNAETEYLPTQYLTELIKSKGFEGILFKSAMGPDYNVVLFDETEVEVIRIDKFEVNKIVYEYDDYIS